MTTFATTAAAAATKTNQPLQLFTMFPPGGASTLKGFAGPAFGTTTTTTTTAAAAASGGGSDPLRNHHHFRGSQSMHGDSEDGEGSGVDPGLPPALFADGPPIPHPPLRPVRHVQHATQWAESKTTVAPGLIVRSTTATVNTTQWSEYTTTVTEGVFHGRSSSSSTQFQTIRNHSGPSTSAAAPNSSLMTSAQYLDDLQLPTQQLDLAAQLGKGSIARKGSLGGRRPPTIRYRRVNSQGSLPYEEQQQLLQQHQQQQLSGMMAPTGSSAPSMNGTESIRSGRSRTPPPRPPPPVFRQQQQQQQQAKPLLDQQPPVPVTSPAVTLQLPPQTDWNCSRSGTPPSLPANSPPPLPDREDLDFVMDEVSSSASVSSSPSPIPGMTDVVEINDKESVGEDGEVVRRRTIITLGPRVVVVGPAAAAPSGVEGSSSSINIITLLNGGPVTSSQSNDCKAATEHHHQAVAAPDPDTPQRANARASAFNARRTIEQRRQQQQQQQQQLQQQQQQQEDEQEEEEEEEEDEIQEAEQEQREQSPAPPPPPPVVVTKTPPASTYLYGEKGSPASSFGGSSLRTMSISMSFDDLDETNSNASMTEQQRMRSGGRNRSEAWYERRQSYGFEAADKLQSLLNTSGSSDVPSITGTAVSRSCDSLCSTVRSTSSAIEKMIPPWIKNPSPKQAEEETGKSPTGSSRLSYFAQSIDDVSADDESEEDHLADKEVPVGESGTPSSLTTAEHKTTTTAQPRRTPTPTSVQRSESSRSATNVLEEAEPIWLRDLRVRRSLRDGRRKPPVIKSPPPIETPVWLGVKLRPTGLSLIDPDPCDGPTCSTSHLPSPTKPHNYTPIFTFTNTSTTSKIQQHLRNSRENLLASAQSSPEPARKKSEEKPPAPAVTSTTLKVSVSSLASSNESREELANHHQTVIESCHNNNNNTTTFRVGLPGKANAKPVPSSSIVIVNSSRESLHSIGTSDNASSSFSCDAGNKLNHHKSIELMRMLEETPLVSTNGGPLRHDRMDSASGGVNTETGSVYSMGDWTECSSTIASVKNSNEDLTQINQTEGQRKAKKVAFGADVKEESDQKRSRPRRIRSRSPESRLREWQERLEEVKSTIIHHHQTATVNQHPEFGVGISISAPTGGGGGGLPLRMFGDDIKDTIQQPESSAPTNHFISQSSPTSDTFRSLLQPRKPYTVTPTAVANPAAASPVKESVVIDSYPPMMKAYSTTTAPPNVEVSPSRVTPMVIRNGIVNFDSSVERKIVILEEKETIPAPKSILKKRSVENLLDLDRNCEPAIKPAVIPVIPAAIPVIPVQVVTASQSVHSGITVSMTNQKKEPPPEQQEILPWRIHLKHVEQPPTVHSVAAVQQQPQPEVVVPPWRIELNRKKTPPFVPRASTPENFFSRGRSPASSESSATSIPGMSAAELIRNLRPNPVMMVARCEVRESVFRPPSNVIEPEAETVVSPESDPLSVRTDHGYHSLEPEAESGHIKRHHSSSARQQTTTVDETKTIDETIAQLNETIEEIRSLETEFDRNGIHSSIPIQVHSPKMDFTPSASSSPAKTHEKPCPAPPAGLAHSKSASKLPENRFVVREIRPCSAVQDSRSYFHSTTSSKETTQHHSTVTSNRRDSVEAEGPEAKAASAANAQLQRLRETTKLLADGHPQLRADAPTVSPSRLMQANESNHNRSTTNSTNSHRNQNGDVTTPTMMTPVKLASPEPKGRLPYVMASGVERDDVTAAHPSPAIPVVHHKPVEVPELAVSSVEELLSRFEKSADDVLPDPPLIRKSSSATSMASSTFNSRSSSSSTTTTNQLRTTQFTKQVKKSSVTAPLAVAMNKPLPAKRSNSIELTSGMPEEKAALLVRKFFGNSVIETKKSRMAKTETIMEESSELGFSSSSFSEEKSLLEVAVETFSSPTPPPPAEEDPSSYDCDDFFHRPSSETEGMSTSSFGSVLDVMTDTTTDDERSNRTTSSMTMTNTSRYSSCSERSVKLSDIINRQDRPSLLDSVPSSSAVTPLMDEYSCATSESASIAISLCQTTTDSSSTGSAFSRSGSSSIRRNKTQRHPTVIRKDKSGVPAVSVKSSIRSPTSKSRGGASTPSRGSHHRSCTASPSTSSTPGVRRRSNGSSSVKSTGDPVKTLPSVARSSKSASSLAAAPVRPPRALQQVNQSTEVKRRSLRTSTSGSTLRNATAASSAKAPAATSASRRSPAPPADRKTSVPSGGVPLANRTNRLVTITSYKSRNSASAKPDDISAVSGIKVTPVAVGSGHYKIRMDQRIAAAAMEKASKTSTQKISPSQRTTGTRTLTTTEKRSTATTSSSRNSTPKQQSDK